MILGFKGIRILESLSARSELCGVPGLPRGICVSATLSEKAGRAIDHHARNMDGVYFSARYVDDIITLSEAGKSTVVSDQLESHLSSLGFSVNHDKAVTVSLQAEPVFSYLGYEFEVRNRSRGRRDVRVRISPSKLVKQKTRICRAFVQYSRDGSFESLMARLRYLAGNQQISKTDNGLLMSGNAYNYREVTDPSCLDTLDSLVRSLCIGRGRLGRLVAPKLSRTQVAALRRVSFRNAFEQRLQVRFTRSRATRMKEALRVA